MGDRLDTVNRIIRDHGRPSGGFGSKKFSKCDICWTCKYFNAEGNKCFLSYEDAIKRMSPGDIDEEYFVVPTPIGDPMYCRCLLWEGI